VIAGSGSVCGFDDRVRGRRGVLAGATRRAAHSAYGSVRRHALAPVRTPPRPRVGESSRKLAHYRAVPLLVLAAASALAARTVRTEAAGLRFTLPSTWTRVPTAAESRAAQYRLPHAAGDDADTEFVLFFLGDGKGEGATETVDRWCERFTQPDGRPSRAAAVVTRSTVQDLHVTAVDLAGTYVGANRGPTQAGVSGYRMLGAIVEGKGGPWYFEMLGPAATVREARGDFDALVRSLEVHR